MNLMHASMCPFLLWWYDDNIAFSMLRFLQNHLNLSETKLPPAPGIIFFAKPYYEKLHARIKLSVDRSSAFL